MVKYKLNGFRDIIVLIMDGNNILLSKEFLVCDVSLISDRLIRAYGLLAGRLFQVRTLRAHDADGADGADLCHLLNQRDLRERTLEFRYLTPAQNEI